MVNSFRLDDGLICLATTGGFLVLNQDYSIIQILVYRRFLGRSYKMFGQSLCCEPSYEHDGRHFFISFTHGDTIESELRSEHIFKGIKDIEQDDELTQFGGFGAYDDNVKTKTQDTPNWIAKFRFNPRKKIIEHPPDMKDESILVMLGNVPNIEEF